MGEVKYYIDASVLVPLILPDQHVGRAEMFRGTANRSVLIVSDFAAAEFSAVAARRMREGKLSGEDARGAVAAFDAWSARATVRANIDPLDIAQASSFIRRFDLPLRTPDAIHMAIAQRLSATLVTFDRDMVVAARKLGVAVVEP